VLVGRSLRALAMRVVVMPNYDIGYQRDDGVIARLIGRVTAPAGVPPLIAVLPGLVIALVVIGFDIAGDVAQRWVVLPVAVLALFAATASASRHDGPLDWLTVAGLRAVEYTTIIVAGLLGGVSLPLVFSLLFVLVMYHYDLIGRLEKQATPVRGEAILRGWDIRIVIIAITTALGWATPVFWVLTFVIGGVFVLGALVGWWRATHADAPTPMPARTSTSSS
jgi:hypothetical protein